MNTITIQRMPVANRNTNYFGYVIAGNINVSWISVLKTLSIEPGTYVIPEGQRNNLEWFVQNNFKLDKFGRLHVQQVMEKLQPAQVVYI